MNKFVYSVLLLLLLQLVTSQEEKPARGRIEVCIILSLRSIVLLIHVYS